MAEPPLKILQICSASNMIYGAVQSLMVLARAQRDAGHTVEFVTRSGKRFGSEVRAEGFTVYEVPAYIKVDPTSILKMRTIMNAGKFDVVHTHLSTSSVNGCLAARASRLPSVATVHGMSGKWSFMAAHHMIGVSQEIKQHLVDQGVKAERISVVYNGYRASQTVPARNSDAFPVLGTVARVTPLKGIEDAIRAVAILKDEFPGMSYIVVGDGDGVEQCERLAADLGVADRVRFTGYQKDIERFLGQMDLFVFPSLKEGMGIALVEAMANGLATVATRVGGIPEVITPDCGTLVGANAPEELAAAIKSLLNDSVKRGQMEAAAKRRAETVFSVEAMLQATDQVYRNLISSRR